MPLDLDASRFAVSGRAAPYPIPGLEPKALAGISRRGALASNVWRSLTAAGFDLLSTRLGLHGEHSDGVRDRFSLFLHPAGILAFGSSHGGDASLGAGASDRINDLHVLFQIDAGARSNVPPLGGSGGWSVCSDGTAVLHSKHDVVNGGQSLEAVLADVVECGPLLPVSRWLPDGVFIPKGFFTDVLDPLDPDGSHTAEEASAFVQASEARIDADWRGFLAGLPADLAGFISENNLSVPRRADRAMPRHLFWGERAREVHRAAGLERPAPEDSALLASWAGRRAFEILLADGSLQGPFVPFGSAPGDFAATEDGILLGTLLLAEAVDDKALARAVGWLEAASDAGVLAELSSSLDARGCSLAMAAFERSKNMGPAGSGACGFFQALARLVGPELRMSGPRASAAGLLFSDADRPDPYGRPFGRAEEILLAAELAGVAWDERFRSSFGALDRGDARRALAARTPPAEAPLDEPDPAEARRLVLELLDEESPDRLRALCEAREILAASAPATARRSGPAL